MAGAEVHAPRLMPHAGPFQTCDVRGYFQKMPLKNRYGDFEIADPKELRALAHPVRLAVLDRLQRHGPATATQLAPHVGATPSVVSWHLRHLASFGLVRDAAGGTSKRERRWRAAARGVRLKLPEDTGGQSAARALQVEMFSRYGELPQQWLLRDEPRLGTRWRRLGGMVDTRLVVTAEELRQIEDGIEKLLAPYARRKDRKPPSGARGVRLLRYVLPEPDDEG